VAAARRARRHLIKKKFGLTLDRFDEMLRHQGGGCAICAATDPGGQGNFHVDHCHVTRVVRGLLCHRCNTGLGLFRESPAALQRAIACLQRHDPGVFDRPPTARSGPR
jgi:hypothetical protein